MDSKDSELQFLSHDDTSSAMEFGQPAPLPSSRDSTLGGTSEPSSGSSAQDSTVVALFKSSSHPTVAVFHVLFKALALTFYLLGDLFTKNFVILFVVVVVLLAFDFWTVKNVTGRIMVGLRWWNDIGEDGGNNWRYESIENPDTVSTSDYRIFWYSMYLTMALWILFAVKSVISFNVENLLIVSIGLALTGSNVMGYWKCSKEQQQRLQSGLQSGAISLLTSGLSGGIGQFFGGSKDGSSASNSAGTYTPVNPV